MRRVHWTEGEDATVDALQARANRLREDAYSTIHEHTRFAPDIEIAARPTLERALLKIQLAERLEDMAGIIEGKDF